MKGQENQLTAVMREAEGLAMSALADLYEDFGIPLYTKDPGRGKFTWPDPQKVGPEELQQLENVWSAPVVERWLMESAARRLAESAAEE